MRVSGPVEDYTSSSGASGDSDEDVSDSAEHRSGSEESASSSGSDFEGAQVSVLSLHPHTASATEQPL